MRVLRGTRLKTVVVVHANHANELDATVEKALVALKPALTALLNQSVLLAGVNDDVDTLAALSERLFACCALPYYLHLLDPVAGAAPTARISIAHLRYNGNWNPEPFGWKQVSTLLANRAKIELNVSDVVLGKEPLAGEYRFAYLTGTDTVQFTDAEREALRRFGYENGILVVDCAGGSEAFARSMEAELKKIFEEELTLMPPNHEVYSADADLSRVEFREKAQKRLNLKTAAGVPMLRMMTKDQKVVVLFSSYDLAVGMVGQPVDAIAGYAPADAQRLMLNMIQWAMKQK